MTRGQVNKNPGNLRSTGAWWQGQTGVDEKGFCIFDTPEHGYRALARNLLAAERHGRVTIGTVIAAWAPPNENDTGAYVRSVCLYMGKSENEQLDFDDRQDLAILCDAITRHEQGSFSWPMQAVLEGVDLALASSAH